MTDTMLFGVLKMPFEMAMSDEISRLQYYARVQELVCKLEQQQAEPVAWAWETSHELAPQDAFSWVQTAIHKMPLYTTPPKQQAEPVAWVLEWIENGEQKHHRLYDDKQKCFRDAESDGGACRPLVYGDTTPPQRPWVGLTDEEILRADPWMGTSDSNINPYQILLKVRTLEAKLKERNT